MGFLDNLKKLVGGNKSEKKPTPVDVIKPADNPSKSQATSFKFDIASPCEGKVIAQQDIPDETFAEGHMGTGVGIVPAGQDFKVYMDGELVVLYKTKHAYFIQEPQEKISVMLHIGINTVEIDESKGAFDTPREVNEQIKIGDDLCKVDLALIEQEGKSTTTALLVQTENMENKKVVFHKQPGEEVKAGDILMSVVSQ